jgi:hypothetical protein
MPNAPFRRSLSVPATLWLAAAAGAQVVNPANQQPGAQGQGAPLVVEGTRVSDLREEDRIGSYGQPEWTSRRRFPETRIYVRPEGTAEFEYWLLPETPKHGATQITTQYEFEFGLPARFQLDLYLVGNQDGNQGPMQIDEQKLEVRWAFADWDRIWGNPTAYVEWTSTNDGPDLFEAKLLLGGEVTSSWHWGTNFVFEHQTGGLQENSKEFTGGLSKTMVDQRFSLGAEFKAALVDDKTNRGDSAKELLIGPSFQYRPTPRSTLDFAPLFGCTHDSPQSKIFIVFGWEF